MNLTLVLTHQCNLACHYCYAGEKENRRMPWEVARAALDRAFLSPDPKLDLAFFGGEPLLEWDLLRRATAYAKERAALTGKRLRLLVTTNGTRLTEERLGWLLAEGFFLGLSMDGGPAATGIARRFKSGRSSFAAVERSLERLLATGTDRYEVIMVVDPMSAAHLADSVDYLLDKGVRRLSLNPNFFTAWDPEAREGWRRGYARAGERFLDSYRRGDPLWINVFDSKITTGVKGGYSDADACSFEGGELAVAPSGNLYPCERLVGDDRDPTWVIGHVDRGLDSQRSCSAAGSCASVEEECATCPLLERCMNWCGCTNYLETGAADRAGGNLCWHEKMLIPMADAIGRTLYEEQNTAFLETFYFERVPEPAPTHPAAIAV